MLNRFLFTPMILAGALLGVSGTAFAQSAPGPAPYDMPGAPTNPNGQGQGQGGQFGPNGQPHHANKMRLALQSLNLNDQQRSQVKSMMKNFKQQRKAGTPVKRREMIAQIESVLTPQQQQQFEATLRQGGSGQGGPGMNGPGPNGMNGPNEQNGPNGQYQNGPDQNGPQGPDRNGPQGPGNQSQDPN